MLAVGFQRVEVLPVRIDFQDFAVATSGLKQDTADWLYVGRIVGNKCQHDLVAAFAIYASHFNSNARLVLIGDTSDHDYVVRVKAEAERLGVADRVVMLGKSLTANCVQLSPVPESLCRSANMRDSACRSSRPWPPAFRLWPMARPPSLRPWGRRSTHAVQGPSRYRRDGRSRAIRSRTSSADHRASENAGRTGAGF